MLITQISVFLENSKGSLRELTKVLAQNGIDMIALSIADTTHFGIIRTVVRECDVEKGLQVLKENGFVAKKTLTFCVAVPNKPAGLDSTLAIIEENNISIEYIYSLNYSIDNKAFLVLKLTKEGMDKEQIAALLKEKGVTLVTQEQINNL